MHENQEVNIVSRDNTNSLIELCLQTEQDRGLSKNSIIELKRYLNDFATYCECQNIYSVKDLTPPFLKDYIDQRCKSAGPNLKKAIVWSLRKFGKHLALLQVVEDNPAKNLRHPKFHPRSELPEYLSTSQLKNLLEYAANNLELRDFVIISLMATTGLRPNEIAGCKQNNVHLNRHCIYVHVKGDWIKETPVSASMTTVLTDYLATRKDDCQALFVNTRGRPVSVSWIQRIVKAAGKNTELSISLTCNHLRHTFGTHAADRNGKIITKALMGHQRLATTEIYTHLSPHRFKALMNLHPYQDVCSKGAANGYK
jgi:site-specific recombinase XerD